MTRARSVLDSSGSGLFLAMAAFAVSHAGGSALVPLMCETHIKWPLALTLPALLVAATASWMSWRRLPLPIGDVESVDGRADVLLASAGVVVAALLCLGVLLQTVAVLTFDGCEM